WERAASRRGTCSTGCASPARCGTRWSRTTASPGSTTCRSTRTAAVTMSDTARTEQPNMDYTGYTVDAASNSFGQTGSDGVTHRGGRLRHSDSVGLGADHAVDGVTRHGAALTPSDTAIRVQNTPRCRGVTRVTQFRGVAG